jgi:DNA-binding transcriptional LysR family regulator
LTVLTVIDLRQIRYFLEVAAEGNMTRAAGRLNITQPALSRQVAALEERLGVALLERVGRGIRLSAAAETLLPELRELVARAEGLSERAAAVGGAERVRLAMIAPPQAIEVFLADALGRFLKRYPDADIRIIEAAAQQNQELLERGEAQLAIAARPIGGQFPSRDLARGFIHVALPVGHRLAGRPRVSVSELDGEPVLLMRRGTLVRDMFESAPHRARSRLAACAGGAGRRRHWYRGTAVHGTNRHQRAAHCQAPCRRRTTVRRPGGGVDADAVHDTGHRCLHWRSAAQHARRSIPGTDAGRLK